MAQATSTGVEWKIRVNDESTKVSTSPRGVLLGQLSGLVSKVREFLRRAWEIACNDPRKVIHCLKVGIALTAVSLFYYLRPLYDGVGGNAMWAVMTVVVVFENTVGATLCKCVNRIIGTFLAGFLAVGVHWVANKSGENLEPFIMGTSVFILASATTFSRFIPSIKRRFDYGAMIFILTFSLVSVAGYRVDKLFEMAHQRLSTIMIGTSLCLLIIMLICPIWAGQDLHALTIRNMDKLASSLHGCVAEFFNGEEANENSMGYKSVLGSKAAEEVMANFARWEPAHGRFNFRHPWNLYLKINATMRSCAYCIEALNGAVNFDNTEEVVIWEGMKSRMSEVCMEVSSNSSSVIEQLSIVMKTMSKSSSIDFLVSHMNSSVHDLQNHIKLFLAQQQQQQQHHHLVPLVTLASLLVEISARIETLVDVVEDLAIAAQFRSVDDEKIKKDGDSGAV